MEINESTEAAEVVEAPEAPTEPQESAESDSHSPTEPSSETPQASAQAAIPAYKASYEFTANDKKHEIPEMYRSLIKDQQTEKQIKEIFEKAYGLDGLKTRHTGLKEEYNQYKSQVSPLMKVAQELDYYQKKGDMGSYFKTLGFTDDQIMKYALQKAQQMELSPEQKRVYDERENANRQQYMLESQFQQTQARLQDLMVQQRQVELQSVLTKPEVQSFAQAFDRSNGPNAFKQECIQRGQAHFALTGQDLPAEDVVQGIVKKYGSYLQAQPQSTPQQQPQAKAPAEVPVIPNTGSGSGSPAAKKFNTLDDIRKYQSEKWG